MRPVFSRALVFAAFVTAGALGAAGSTSCAGNTRAHPLADWTLYEEPAGLFSLRYPDPPWAFASEAAGAVHFEIRHRGIVDRPDRPVVETLDVAVVAPAQDLDAFVAARIATVVGAGNFLLCAVEPCAAAEVETFEEDRALGFAYRTPIGADATEYFVLGEERIVGATFYGVRSTDLPEYALLVQSIVPRGPGI